MSAVEPSCFVVPLTCEAQPVSFALAKDEMRYLDGDTEVLRIGDGILWDEGAMNSPDWKCVSTRSSEENGPDWGECVEAFGGSPRQPLLLHFVLHIPRGHINGEG
jgi:hypothetical protein